MTHPDDTQPRRPDNMPIQAPVPQPDVTPYGYDYGGDADKPLNEGPGCFVWGCMGLFSAAMAVFVVILASFAGWTEGLQIAEINATATRDTDINTQCRLIESDLQAGNTGLVQRRIEDLLLATPVPPCLLQFAPTATAVYIQNLPTETPPPTLTTAATLPATSIPATITLTNVPAIEIEVTEEIAPDTGFDLDALLAEARTQIDAGQYGDAVDTLDAISAIDPTYQKATVDSLLYNALTTQARQLYRSDGNLAEAILLTNQAERYGDVGELNFERAVAQSYLTAQTALDVDYSRAIQNLLTVISQAPNYRNAATQLYDQYEKYGDALAIGGAACDALIQYNAAIALRSQNPAALTTKRDDAERACQGTSAPVAATPAPGEAAPEQPAPTSEGVAPIGVGN